MHQIVRSQAPFFVSLDGHANGHLTHVAQSDKWENKCCTKASDRLRMKEKPSCSQCQSLEVPKSPAIAMEFLCRSWSTSATDFLQILSSNNYLLPRDDNNEAEVHEEIMEGEKKVKQLKATKSNIDRMGNTWVPLEKGRKRHDYKSWILF
ncbi:VAN3-binding protein-like, auxin canalization domain [Dillenia turbinata]|uniref:VAN3-binding protein-like, auxin canalization domain n=1 Tax=Dillenia turbinata TaxID=194707 RepID=A0AAN8ZJK3_9MAGN